MNERKNWRINLDILFCLFRAFQFFEPLIWSLPCSPTPLVVSLATPLPVSSVLWLSQSEFCGLIRSRDSNRSSLFLVPYLEVDLLAKTYRWPQIGTCCAFDVIHGHEQSGDNLKNWSFSLCLFLVEIKQGDILPVDSSVTLLYIHFMVFFAFLCFLLVMTLFEMTPSVLLTCYLAFLSSRKLPCALWRKYLC